MIYSLLSAPGAAADGLTMAYIIVSVLLGIAIVVALIAQIAIIVWGLIS